MSRLLMLLGLVVLVSACEAPDYPAFEGADAWCEDDHLFWDLWADVSHERGPRAVEFVYVRPAWVEYDADDNVILTDLGVEFDLEYQADGQWALAIPSGETPLDCEYPFEYYFLFTAQDEDGDSVRTDLIN